MEPLVQDTFLAFVAQISTIRDPKRWLVSAFRNICRQHWRDRRRLPVPVSMTDLADAPSHDDSDRLLVALTAEKILNSLPQRDRTMLHKFYIAGESAASIAEQTGTTVGTVHVALHRTRRRAHRLYNSTRGAEADE